MFSKYESADLVRGLRCHKYQNRKFSETLKMMNSTTGIIVEGAFLRRFREQGFDLNPDRDNRSIYYPDAMFKALSKYCVKYPDKPKDPAFRDAISLAWKAFGGDKSLKVFPLENLYETIKGEKSSGAPLFTSKKEAYDSDFIRMLKVLEGGKVPEPCVAFHRVQHGSEGPKQRLVWGYPQSMTLLEARYARPIIDRFKLLRSPMAFGLRRFELSARCLPITNSNIRYGLDMSAFDSSIPPWLISEAFQILRSWFHEDQVDHGWDIMVNYFIHTPIIMPDGYVYRKHTGVPSGSYFTQLVDSIANFIIVQYCCLKALGKPVEDGKLLVLGDDSLFGLDMHVPLVRLTIPAKELGFTINVVKSEISRYGEPFQFLGHYWIKGLVDREVIEIVKRMVFPEKPNNIKDTRERLFTRALGYYCDALSSHGLYLAAMQQQSNELERVFTYGKAKAVTDWQKFRENVMQDSCLVDALDQSNVGILM